jgi:hypothetical protein
MKGIGVGVNFTRCEAEFVRSSIFFPFGNLEDNSHGSAEKVVDGYWDDAITEGGEKRFLQVSGVPGNIVLADISKKLQEEQDDAIANLTRQQVTDIYLERMDAVGTFARNQPKSALIGYMEDTTDRTFSKRKVAIVSSLVAPDIVYKGFLRDRWDQMTSAALFDASKVFEKYCLMLMARPAQPFYRRPCVGTSNKVYKTKSRVSLGGCTEIR